MHSTPVTRSKESKQKSIRKDIIIMEIKTQGYEYLNKPVWGYPTIIIHEDEKQNKTIIPEKGMLCFSNDKKKHEEMTAEYQKDPSNMTLVYFVPFKKNSDTELAWSKGKLRKNITIADSEESAWECLIHETKERIEEQRKMFFNAINMHTENMNALKKSNAYHNGRIFPDECLQAGILQQGCNDFMNFVEHTNESFQTLYEYLLRTYNPKY